MMASRKLKRKRELDMETIPTPIQSG